MGFLLLKGVSYYSREFLNISTFPTYTVFYNLLTTGYTVIPFYINYCHSPGTGTIRGPPLHIALRGQAWQTPISESLRDVSFINASVKSYAPELRLGRLSLHSPYCCCLHGVQPVHDGLASLLAYTKSSVSPTAHRISSTCTSRGATCDHAGVEGMHSVDICKARNIAEAPCQSPG